MKILKVLLVITFFSGLILVQSCKKDSGLTKATQNGANTFSCKINDKVFIPKVSLFGPSPIFAQVVPSGSLSNLTILTTNPDSPVQHVEIFINTFNGPGTYQVKTTDYSYCEYQINYFTGYLTYSTVGTDIGSVTITKYDTVNKIISGTFDFTVYNTKNKNDLISITKGRFDISL